MRKLLFYFFFACFYDYSFHRCSASSSHAGSQPLLGLNYATNTLENMATYFFFMPLQEGFENKVFLFQNIRALLKLFHF